MECKTIYDGLHKNTTRKNISTINHGHKYCRFYRCITYSHSFFNEIIKIRFLCWSVARATRDLTIGSVRRIKHDVKVFVWGARAEHAPRLRLSALGPTLIESKHSSDVAVQLYLPASDIGINALQISSVFSKSRCL